MDSIEKAAVLKTLLSKKKKLELDITHTKQQITELNTQLSTLKGELEKTNKHIKTINESKQELMVSEHAILRFLERAENVNINIEEITNKILTEKLKEQYKTLGNGLYPIPGYKVSARIKDGVIITVISTDKNK